MSNNIKNKYRHLLVIPIVNLLFMNFFFYYNNYIEWTYLFSWIICVCSIIFDIYIIYFIFLIILGRQIKLACAATQVLTLLWSLINTFYGRFFFQYISLSAFGEIQSIQDNIVINSILSEIRWYDFFYFVSTIIFIIQYRSTPTIKVNLRFCVKTLMVPFFTLLISCSVYTVYHFSHPLYRHNFELYVSRINQFMFDGLRAGTPNLAHFQSGSTRSLLSEIIDNFSRKELTEEQIQSIANYYQDYTERTTLHPINPDVKNVIIILLESFLSTPINLNVDGIEITPFLNSLKCDSDVYYNSKMLSDITCGESGDGQFIYMNGILPLLTRITVGHIKGNTLPSLPKQLKEYYGIKHTEIYVPSKPNLWQQSDMNVVYGIDKMYSQGDYPPHTAINDEFMFKFASDKITKTNEPFFSMILSISGHNPYDKYYGENILRDNKSLSNEYKNYLNTCHYTDRQIGCFIDVLKQKDLYDNSLIIITSDHYAHVDFFNMGNIIPNYIPLFIINGNINKETAWNGEMRQLDVYTTILDILNINSKWRGLGHTILSQDYHNSVNNQIYNISKMIIEGNYFKNE